MTSGPPEQPSWPTVDRRYRFHLTTGETLTGSVESIRWNTSHQQLDTSQRDTVFTRPEALHLRRVRLGAREVLIPSVGLQWSSVAWIEPTEEEEE